MYQKDPNSVAPSEPLKEEGYKKFQSEMWVVKDWRLYFAGTKDAGKEFQSLEVIKINELTNAFIRLISN